MEPWKGWACPKTPSLGHLSADHADHTDNVLSRSPCSAWSAVEKHFHFQENPPAMWGSIPVACDSNGFK